MASLTKTPRNNPATGQRAIYWGITYREGGKQPRIGIGFVTKAVAESALRAHKQEADQARAVAAAQRLLGVVPTPPTPPRPTIPTLEEWWGGRDFKPWKPSPMLDLLDAEKSSKVTRDTAHAARMKFLPLLGTLRLDEISDAHRDPLLAAMRRDGLSSRSCIMYIGWLRRSLQAAVTAGLIAKAPVLRPPADTDKKRVKFLMPHQTAALQIELNRRAQAGFLDRTDAQLAIQMQETLAARPGEIRHQRWENLTRSAEWTEGVAQIVAVDLPDDGRWKPKKGRERAVSVPPALLGALQKHWLASGQPRSGWIFPRRGDARWPVGGYRKALANACTAANLPRLTQHGLRHTGATRFAMNGVGRRTVMEIGGWSDGSMLDSVYEHTTDAHMMEVMAKFEVKPPAPPSATTASPAPSVPDTASLSSDVAQIGCTTSEPDHAPSK